VQVANTLSAGISIIEDIIPLTSSTGFPESGRIKIDSEIITYASVSGNNLIGCSRGQNGTTAATHTSSTAVTCATLLVTCVRTTARWTTTLLRFLALQRLGDAITADILNQEYQVTLSCFVQSMFQVEARTVSTIASITGTGWPDIQHTSLLQQAIAEMAGQVCIGVFPNQHGP
jgi:hypothetical protein